MIKVEHVETWGFEHAIRGMRNPKNSWNRSDSDPSHIGENDLHLMQSLFKAGSEHRKYLRQIMVSMDITAPLYWWKEFDTYKVGTVADSCSTMHKIHAKEFTAEDFSFEHLNFASMGLLEKIISTLNLYRTQFLETKDKLYWWQMIQLLPTSYNQKRTVTLNYEVCARIIEQRSHHKLDEWRDFCEILQKNLPFFTEIIKK